MNGVATESITRRQALAAAAYGTAAAALSGCATSGEPSPGAGGPTPGAGGRRMPVAYVPHGGGPWPFVDVGFGDPAELEQLASYLRSLASLPPSRPRAVLAVSAHWE